MSRPPLVPVWDLPIRLFHWSLAASIGLSAATGFLGGAEAIRWHIGGGLAALALVIARIVWASPAPPTRGSATSSPRRPPCWATSVRQPRATSGTTRWAR